MFLCKECAFASFLSESSWTVEVRANLGLDKISGEDE